MIDQRLVVGQPVLEERVFVAVETIFGYLHRHGRPVKSDSPATRIGQMAHGGESSHIVVHHHPAGIDTRADAVKEDKGQPLVYQGLEVVISAGGFGLRHDDTGHLVFQEVAAYLHLSLVLLVALRHDDLVTARTGFLLDAANDAGKVEMVDLRHDEPDDMHRGRLDQTQLLAQHVGEEVVLLGVCLDGSTGSLADALVVAQRTRYRSDRHAKLLGDVLHCDRRVLFQSGHIAFFAQS